MMMKAEVENALTALQNSIEKTIGVDENRDSIDQQIASIQAAIQAGDEYTFQLEDLLNHLITFHPNLTAAIPRELLWTAGGSCMHFLSDEEINQFADNSSGQQVQH